MGYLIVPGFDSPDISAAKVPFFQSYKRSIIGVYTAEEGVMCIAVNCFGVTLQRSKMDG